MADHDPRIGQIERDIATSDLSPSEKAILTDDLDYAIRLNGSDDDVRIGLKKLTLSLIRTRLAAPEATKTIVTEAVTKAVEAQASKCNDAFNKYTTQKTNNIKATNQDIKKQFFNALIENMRVLIITIGLVISLLGISAIVTRQIGETGTFIETASKAIKDR